MGTFRHQNRRGETGTKSLVQESLTQLSGEATVETNQGDMVLRGAGIAVFQGGVDVKISKG